MRIPAFVQILVYVAVTAAFAMSETVTGFFGKDQGFIKDMILNIWFGLSGVLGGMFYLHHQVWLEKTIKYTFEALLGCLLVVACVLWEFHIPRALFLVTVGLVGRIITRYYPPEPQIRAIPILATATFLTLVVWMFVVGAAFTVLLWTKEEREEADEMELAMWTRRL
jgi:hypothetical protein